MKKLFFVLPGEFILEKGLTGKGRVQVERLLQELNRGDLLGHTVKILCSPQQESIETAQILSDGLGVGYEPDSTLWHNEKVFNPRDSVKMIQLKMKQHGHSVGIIIADENYCDVLPEIVYKKIKKKKFLSQHSLQPADYLEIEF